jgi:hypothetical protein
MRKYEISTIGDFHLNHNEDSFSVNEISDSKIMISVMDGCSMGKESHFASTLISKILRKRCKEIGYREFAEKTEKGIKSYLRELIEQLFKDLGRIKNELNLETEEVLSTLILSILDLEKKEIEIMTIGDGVICCNGILHEYEQGDKPDYLGYHLNEDFEAWFEKQKQRLSFKDVKDISLSTDGIFTFKNFDDKEYELISDQQIVEFLLIDDKWQENEMMLKKKILEIENKNGLRPSDDLTIVRVKVEE